MKYPKVWDIEGIGAPGGEAYVRFIENVGGPYMKSAQGIDGAPLGESLANKRGGTKAEVHVTPKKPGVPYLWGTYAVEGESIETIKTGVLSPQDFIAYTTTYKSIVSIDGANTDASIFKVFVGDDYILRLFCDINDYSQFYAQFWPALARARALTWEVFSEDMYEAKLEALANNQKYKRVSVTYIDKMLLSGLGDLWHNFSLAATGWKDEATRYRFCVTATAGYFGQQTIEQAAPVCFVGNTGTWELQQVAFPFYPNRIMYPFNTHCIGPGKLQAYVFTRTEGSSYPYDEIAPFIARSSDHGVSWSTVSPSWLAQLLYPATDNTSKTTSNTQRFWMGRSICSIYIGNSRSLVYIGNAWNSTAQQYERRLYLMEGDGTASRVTWPPDTWGPVDATGRTNEPFTTGKHLSFEDEYRLMGAHYSFGENCAYFSIVEDGVYKLMYTKDAGASWSYSAPQPANMGFCAGTMVSPFTKSTVINVPDEQGRIVFPAPDFAANKLRFYEIDTAFAEWRLIGVLIKAKGELTYHVDHNRYFVYFGGGRFPPYVYPAYPGEFMKPKEQ